MRPTDIATSLRNSRRSLGDGTLGGRSRIATRSQPGGGSTVSRPHRTEGSRYVTGIGTRRIFVQNTAPTTAEAAPGDIWIDTT